MFTRQFGEIRPYHAVEEVRSDRAQRFVTAIYGQGNFEFFLENAIDQHWEASNVVKVGVGQEHMPDRMKFVQGQVADAGSGIEQDIVVNEHCRRSCASADASAAAKNSYPHIATTLKNMAEIEEGG
jgi:hypothetical protein